MYELALNLRVEARDVVTALKMLGAESPGHLTLLDPKQIDKVTGAIDGSFNPAFTMAVRVRRLEQRLQALEASQ